MLHPRRLIRYGVCAIAACAIATPFVRAATMPERQIYATVVDSDGRPIAGLAAEDFSLREGDLRKPVLAVARAIDPLVVIVVVDGFAVKDVPDLGRAIESVSKTLAADGPHALLLVRDGGVANALAVHAGSPASALDAPLTSLVGKTGALVDRVEAACRALDAAPTDRRHVLAIVKDPARVAIARPERLTDALALTQATLWTVEITTPAAAPAGRAPADALLDAAMKIGGGLRVRAPNGAALDTYAARVADLLVSQYIVTYTWPDPMLSALSLTTRHGRGDVLTPSWSREP